MTGLVWDVYKLRIATEAAGIALWSWNVDTDQLELDERGHILWGVPNTGNITFEILSARIHPEDLDRVRAAFAATREMLGLRDGLPHSAQWQGPVDIRTRSRRRSRYRRADHVRRVH
jgi:hypothetical protein